MIVVKMHNQYVFSLRLVGWLMLYQLWC